MADRDKLQVLKDALYEAARDHGSDQRLFSQRDLLDMHVIPQDNLVLLMQVIQILCDEKLFVGNTTASGLSWRWRSREDAKKYTSLPNSDLMMVYAMVDEAGADGIWNRTIKNKLNMADSLMKTCIKYLEQKGYIASMKNVEHPNKKMYIKANLRPSDRATGGPWFTEGELDTAFINELQEIVFDFIKQKSTYTSHGGAAAAGTGVQGGTQREKAPKKGVVQGTIPEDTKGTKRSAGEISNDDTAAASAPTTTAKKTRPGKPQLLPLPAGYKLYPTVSDIAKFIHHAGITNNTTLSEADIQQLVDVLYYDGLVESVKVNGRKGYRVTHIPKQDTRTCNQRRLDHDPSKGGIVTSFMGVEPSASGLMEAPCGRCPVYDMCEEGGPVSPSNCVYFRQWLDGDEVKEQVISI
ncbi:RNA polymerase Rpc34 [Pseudoneurospora amorphoporcata]|uniref:DNA-directed RNA polymerase III subunit RPC6 n=1 Tax=Pseudoneurospora amorphoporcata TaxID=241081 RepID=A0AAN6SF90_9PEZI|nr:RNA polymerase Rpc34 [Pseudoneurospora amorphoporcata]